MAPSSWLDSWTEVCWDRDCCTPSSELCREQVRRGTGLRKALTTGHCSGGQPTTMETRSEQKYDHSLHQPPLQCRAITAPYPSRAPAASSSNPLALQQPCASKDVSWARQDLPGVLMTNRAKLPLVSCQHRCAGVMGPLHPHGQRGLQERGEVSP